MVATPGLRAQTRWGEDIISELRESGFLEEYERDYTFEDYISETISDNFYDFDFITQGVLPQCIMEVEAGIMLRNGEK